MYCGGGTNTRIGARIQYTRGSTKTNRRKCIFKRNLNLILIFHGSLPNRRFVLLFIRLSFCLGLSRAVLLRRNLPFYLSLFSFDRSAPVASHLHRHFIPLSFSRLSFPLEMAFLLGCDVPPLLHFSQPRRGIILDGTVDNVYGT